MEIQPWPSLATHILQRREVLHSYYLDYFWEKVPAERMRERPHPRVNSLAWNLWHVARVEDAKLNRYVVDRPQVLDEGGWLERMGVPLRHSGSGMTFPEVDELNMQIDLAALHDYSHAVAARTREIIAELDGTTLDEIIPAERIRQVLVDEGEARSDGLSLVEHYAGWKRGRYLLAYALTHSFEHVGEMGVIISLLGIELD
jgi:hypothetical protein